MCNKSVDEKYGNDYAWPLLLRIKLIWCALMSFQVNSLGFTSHRYGNLSIKAMVSREYGKCLLCGTKFILRVGIGLEKVCAHTFDCPSCYTPLTIEARTGEPPSMWIDMKDNIERIPKDTRATVVINLHPSFAFRLEDYHSERAFASMQAIDLIKDKMRIPSASQIVDVARNFEVPHTASIWPIVKNVLIRALKADPAQVLSTQIALYETERRNFKSEFRCTTAFKTAASFFDDIFYPAIGNLRSPLRQYAKNQREAHGTEFSRLIEFYADELEQQNLDRYLSTFTDYFKYFDQFRQVLLTRQ